jgi:hypothetical protein
VILSFGPNTFPAHGSALFNCEVQVSYLAHSLFAPIIDQRASVIEVKEEAENVFVNKIHQRLAGSVFAAGCSNWYINEFGRNSASWPGYCRTYWLSTALPQGSKFLMSGGSKMGPIYRFTRWIRTSAIKLVVTLLLVSLARYGPGYAVLSCLKGIFSLSTRVF